MSKGEIQYFLMFAAGIAVFWLGGLAVGQLPLAHNHLLAESEGLITTLAIYALGLIVLLLITLGRRRSIKPVAIATIVVVVLALVGAQLLVHLGHGRINSQLDLGLLTFASYLLYGAFYVIGNVVAQRLART